MTKILQKEVEFDIEFTIHSDLYKARGFTALFTQNDLFTEDFDNHQLGYRTDYEGVGVYVFRNPLQQNKWFVMTLQGQGSRPVIRQKNAIHSGMRSLNNCQIDVQQGVRTGFKVTFVDNKIIVEIKDSDDVSYKECSQQLIINKSWSQYNFALAARNSQDDRGAMQITDVDIDSIKISVLDSDNMYDAKTKEDERSQLILMKHDNLNKDAGGEEADLDRLFELNVATKMANEQRKNLIFIEE